METLLDSLLDRIENEARRASFPLDLAVYEAAHKDPCRPILCAGNLDAEVCVLGRDLGRDEVRQGQPLIGAGGSLVRRAILEAWGDAGAASGSKPGLEAALKYVLLTNTVPYKPPGNKAYTEPVKQRFRPFLTELLTRLWTGTHVITLGNEAFRWFAPYGESNEFETISATDGRFDRSFTCRLPILENGASRGKFKTCLVLPLPHPSPLNRRWLSSLPEMLAGRLREVRKAARQ